LVAFLGFGLFFLDAALKNNKLRFYFIDPNVDEIVNERLSTINDRIIKIDKEFGYKAIEELTKE
jgi:hypothetical protein